MTHTHHTLYAKGILGVDDNDLACAAAVLPAHLASDAQCGAQLCLAASKLAKDFGDGARLCREKAHWLAHNEHTGNTSTMVTSLRPQS